MVYSRAEGEGALSSIIQEVFRLVEYGSPLVLALNQNGYHDLLDIHSCMGFEDIDDFLYVDSQGNKVKLQGLHMYPLRILKYYYMHHIVNECLTHGDSVVVEAFNVAAKAFDVKEYDRFRMGSAYCEMNNCTSDWARLTAKE
jgi:hypothetical protein